MKCDRLILTQCPRCCQVTAVTLMWLSHSRAGTLILWHTLLSLFLSFLRCPHGVTTCGCHFFQPAGLKKNTLRSPFISADGLRFPRPQRAIPLHVGEKAEKLCLQFPCVSGELQAPCRSGGSIIALALWLQAAQSCYIASDEWEEGEITALFWMRWRDVIFQTGPISWDVSP